MERVTNDVLHLPEIMGGPTILLGETVTIVDTGVPGSEHAILAAVADAGRTAENVSDVVITHADGDHVGSLAALVELTGATVWAGEHEADVIEGKAAGRGGDVTLTPAASIDASGPARHFPSTAESRSSARKGIPRATSLCSFRAIESSSRVTRSIIEMASRVHRRSTPLTPRRRKRRCERWSRCVPTR
jgi:Cft2 family RNA processing exonuclease